MSFYHFKKGFCWVLMVVITLGSSPAFVFAQNTNWRDPFLYKGVNLPGLDKERQKQKLEEFSLKSLHFVGLLQEGSKTMALIKGPKGMVCLVSVGDYLGKNNGHIIAIDKDKIQVEEAINGSGKQLVALPLCLVNKVLL